MNNITFNVCEGTTAVVLAKCNIIDGKAKDVKLITKVPSGHYYSFLNEALEMSEKIATNPTDITPDKTYYSKSGTGDIIQLRGAKPTHTQDVFAFGDGIRPLCRNINHLRETPELAKYVNY